MGAGELVREDYKRTKHDSYFSKWKVLVGPNDWEDYCRGKEGVARYRVHNLPDKSCPGVYELGIAVARSALERDVVKFDSDDIVVAYLGQTENVRSRLQRYGRSGAHLANIYITRNPIDSESESSLRGSCLFEEIFSRGCSLAFRWAAMKSKKEAEETEAKLLDTFDYAWNKGSNLVRRPDDILKKLDEIASSTGRFSSLHRIFAPLTQKKVGVKIKGDKLLLQEDKVCADADDEGNNFLSGIFKFSRSRPKLVSEKQEIYVNSSNTCGVILSDGSFCTRPPVAGRKRCEEHKGRKIYGLSSKLFTEGKSPSSLDLWINSNTLYDQNSYAICGVILGNGSSCGRKPVVGRKRCEEHKGMKINALISKTVKNKSGVNLGGCASDDWLHNDTASKSKLLSDRCGTDRDSMTVYGATLKMVHSVQGH